MPATALEQMILELVNRARLDPAAEAARFGIALNEGVPAGDTISTASKQPLAMNETLLGTARAHSQDEIDRDYFAHNTPEGVDPFQRMTNAGYNFTTAGENIAAQMTSGTVTDQSTINLHQLLFVDQSVPGRGHRVNILLGDFQEIGVGQASGEYHGLGAPMGGGNATMLTEDFGVRGNQQFLTGVSYADTDHDNFYSIGEGRASMSVGAGGSTSTGVAGGYSLAVSSGIQAVTFSSGGLASPINVLVSIAANTNAKVDVIDQGTIATSASLTDLGGATKIIGLGTFGLALTGDSGNDTFIGTKGNDTIDGAGGSDTVVFSGNFSAYTRTNQPNGSIQIAGLDGTDALSNVEFLQFADQTIAVGAVTSSIVISDQSLAEGNNGAKVATFTVTRSGGGTAAFDVNFATADGSATVADHDYIANSGTLHFGTGVNTQTISVTINADTKIEASETFFVNLSGATNGATISDNQGTGTIVDDDGLHVRDFNADGHSDILWQNANGTPAVWLMNGTSAAAFGPALTNPGPAWHEKAAADFNGDGKSDILWQNDNGTPGVWLMDGTGVAAFGPALANPGPAWHANAAADFNGDGKADILWQNDNGTPAVWLMDGTGVVTAGPALVNPGPAWHEKAAADFNGDGKADILWQNDDGTAAVWLMDGTNVAAYGPALTNPGPAWHATAAADFDSDGKADILWQNDNGTPGVWLMNGTNVSVFGPGLTNPGPAWHEKAAADFNGDHRADILWQNDDGTAAVWLMGGAGVSNFGPALANPGSDWHII
jgi:Calx-beta domain/FG-GAP-like repeat/Cysteine-rich secretory protein family/RTX calcium-binding nonapeptide repeat (4 copies)